MKERSIEKQGLRTPIREIGGKKNRVLVPVPDADLEGVGLAIGERGEGIDPPLSEPRRGLHPVRALAHPRRRCRDRCGDLIDTVEDPQQVLRLSQFRLLLFHYSLSTSTPRAGAEAEALPSSATPTKT